MTSISRLATRLLIAIGCTLTVGCSSFAPEGETPFQPPPVYREWWAKTQACSGRKADFSRIRWSLVEGNSFPCKSGKCVGHWQSDGQIWIASDWADNEMVVRHEILHALIGQPGHPNPPFGAECPLTWDTWKGGSAGLKIQRVD